MARKRFEVPAGERTRVVHRRSGSIPREYVIVTEQAGGGVPTGSVEVRGSRWLFRRPPTVVPLQPEVRVVKGFWDTLFSVHVVPDQDVTVTVH